MAHTSHQAQQPPRQPSSSACAPVIRALYVNGLPSGSRPGYSELDAKLKKLALAFDGPGDLAKLELSYRNRHETNKQHDCYAYDEWRKGKAADSRLSYLINSKPKGLLKCLRDGICDIRGEGTRSSPPPNQSKPNRRKGAKQGIWNLPIWEWRQTDGPHPLQSAANDVLRELLDDPHVDRLVAVHVFRSEIYPLVRLYEKHGADEMYRQELEEQILFYLLASSFFRYHLLEVEEAELTSIFGRNCFYTAEDGTEVVGGTGTASIKTPMKTFRGEAWAKFDPHQKGYTRVDWLSETNGYFKDTDDERNRIDQVIDTINRVDSLTLCSKHDNSVKTPGPKRNIAPGVLGPSLIFGLNLFAFRNEQELHDLGRCYPSEYAKTNPINFSTWVADDPYYERDCFHPSRYTRSKEYLINQAIQNWSGFCRGELILIKRAKWALCRVVQTASWLPRKRDDNFERLDPAHCTQKMEDAYRHMGIKTSIPLDDKNALMGALKPYPGLPTVLARVEGDVLNGNYERPATRLAEQEREKGPCDQEPLPIKYSIGSPRRAAAIIDKVVPEVFCIHRAGPEKEDSLLVADELWKEPQIVQQLLEGVEKALKEQYPVDTWPHQMKDWLAGVDEPGGPDDNDLDSRSEFIRMTVLTTLQRLPVISDGQGLTEPADDTLAAIPGHLYLSFNAGDRGQIVDFDTACYDELCKRANRPVVCALIGRIDSTEDPFIGNETVTRSQQSMYTQLMNGTIIPCVRDLAPDHPFATKRPESLDALRREAQLLGEQGVALRRLEGYTCVSHKHAVLLRWNGAYYYVDAKSTNGTTLVRMPSTFARTSELLHIIQPDKARHLVKKKIRKNHPDSETLREDDIQAELERLAIVQHAELADGDRLYVGRLVRRNDASIEHSAKITRQNYLYLEVSIPKEDERHADGKHSD